MDSFPVRRGIGLSRTPHAVPHLQAFQRDPFPKYPQQLTKTMPPQITVMNKPNNNQMDHPNAKIQSSHGRTFSIGVPPTFQQDKPPVFEAPWKETLPRSQPTVQINLNQPLQHKLPLFSSLPTVPQEQEIGQLYDQNKVESKQVSQQLQTKFTQPPSIRIQPTSPNVISNSPLKEERTIVSQQIAVKPAAETAQIRLMPTQQNNQNQNIKAMLREKQQLLEELSQTKKLNESWQQEKQQLIQHIQEQSQKLKQQQEKLNKCEQQYSTKVASLQYQIRLMKGNRNRLELEIDSNKKLFKSEREKNEKTKQQMNKLIFFEDDLIHSKDYHKLKEQLQFVLTENAKLFSEHQQFIKQVADSRRATSAKLAEVQEELEKLKCEANQYRETISNLMLSGEDKMTILKLQSEINFHKKKSDELIEQICSKDQELQSAMQQTRELTSNMNDKKMENNSFLDQISLWQIQDSLALYETRVAELNSTLTKKQAEIDKQKKTIQALTSQLRRTREERDIKSLKEKNSENSLKNDVDILQKGHQTEIELRNKKICNLEESLQRKAKEIGEKDKFIKQFLIGRLKQLDSAGLDSLLLAIKNYFEPSSDQ